MKTEVLYHFGARRPQPRPCRHPKTWARDGHVFRGPVVFLTPDPACLFRSQFPGVSWDLAHGMDLSRIPHFSRGYAVEVPTSLGYRTVYDGLPEVIVSAEEWQHCRLLRRLSEREVLRLIRPKDSSFATFARLAQESLETAKANEKGLNHPSRLARLASRPGCARLAEMIRR